MHSNNVAFSFDEILNKKQLNNIKRQKSGVFEHENPNTSSFHILKQFLRKYNHHHDPETGRFTSGNGSSSEQSHPMIRTKPAPKNTKTAYKVFVVKDGKLYPPMVANPNALDTPVGVWLDASEGTKAPDSKTGRPQVKAGGKGTQGGSGSLAYRPGWHLGEYPEAKQFARKNPETGKKELFPENFIWAECEIAADVNYQEEAMSYGYNKNGKFQHALAGLPKLPTDGYYTYRTNPDPTTQPWYITGSMKVTRLLTDAETDKILRDRGITPMKRKGGELDPKALGLDESLFTVKKSRVEKDNPYRDPNTGRFTFAPGGSKGSGGANTPEGNKNSSERKNGAHSSSFTPAKTVAEARQYAQDALGFMTVDYSIAKTPGMWESLDLDTINEINGTITDIQKQYPELKGKVEHLTAGSQRSSYYMAVVHDSNGPQNVVNRLEIGRPCWDGLENTRQQVAQDVEAGFHPPESDVSSLIWHEYGHVMAHVIRCKESLTNIRGDLEKLKTENNMLSEAMVKLGYEANDASSYSSKISKYAEKDAGETFAEAFSEYHTSSNPRRESVVLTEIALGKVDGYRQKAAERQAQMDALLAEKGWAKSRREMSFSFSELLNIEQLKKKQAPTGCGVIVVKDGKVLAGRRIESNGRGRICGPGGNIEHGESPEEAAKREAFEEFGITCNSLKPLGVLGGESAVFLCTDFSGEPKTDEKEMTDPRWLDIDTISQAESFPPFYHSLELLEGLLEKANPYRDPATGRFTFGPGGPSSGSSSVPKSLQGYGQRESEWNKSVEYYAKLGRSTEEQQAKATKVIAEVIENNNFSMRVSGVDELEAIINDGFFRNQFETGDSDGAYDPDYRRSAEQELFGTDPFSVDGADRPKYGYVGMADAQEEHSYFGSDLMHYGDIRVDFKKEALMDRTTYTVGDSLDFHFGTKPLAGKCDNPSAKGMEPGWQIGTVANLSADDYTYKGKPNPFELAKAAGPGNLNYVELQYHGNLSIQDIRCVYLPDHYIEDVDNGWAPITDLMDAAGVPYEFLA